MFYMLEYFLEFILEFVLPIIVVCVLVIGLMFGLVTLISQPMCYNSAKDIGYPYKWEALGGCMLEVEKGKWIPIANYRYFEETK